MPESMLSAVRSVAIALPLGSGLKDHPLDDSDARTHRPKIPTYRPLAVPAPPLQIRQPVVHFCAVYLAAVLLFVLVSLPKSGCPNSVRLMLASRYRMSSSNLCLLSRALQALEAMSLRSCPPVPSKPPAVALFSVDTPRASSLYAVQSARASLGHYVRRQLQN